MRKNEVNFNPGYFGRACRCPMQLAVELQPRAALPTGGLTCHTIVTF